MNLKFDKSDHEMDYTDSVIGWHLHDHITVTVFAERQDILEFFDLWEEDRIVFGMFYPDDEARERHILPSNFSFHDTDSLFEFMSANWTACTAKINSAHWKDADVQEWTDALIQAGVTVTISNEDERLAAMINQVSTDWEKWANQNK